MDDLEDPLLRHKLARYRRSTWIPQVADGAGAADASRLGGAPWLRADEAWPACTNCGRPMRLFVQLNARDLPPAGAEALNGGMMQFFYCTRADPTCELDCDAWAPFARSTRVRLVPRDDLAGGTAAAAADGEIFPARQIIGWDEAFDYPNAEETESLGVELSDDESNALYDAELTHSGEKLLGWPHWVQGLEYPDCPDCGTRMELLFQVDSDQNLPWRFGDLGIGHITQCRQHRGQLAFGWACT